MATRIGMKSRRLMVIGGSGFFGKSFLDAYQRGRLAPWQVDEVIIVARRATDLKTTHPHLLSASVRLVNADVGHCTELPQADYVIHAASSTDAQRYITHADEERANILRSIDNFCHVAARDLRGARILYTSSGAVYGAQPADIARVQEHYRPGDVADMEAYKRDYAEAKRMAEQRIAQFGQAFGVGVTVARCFAFMGHYLPRDQHFAIGNFMADGLAGRPVVVKATSPVYRSYMHADDLVDWLMAMVADAQPHCPIYNVGSDEAVLMGDLAQLVAARCGVVADVQALTDNLVNRYVPDIEFARHNLGLQLKFDLASGIDEVLGRLRRAD